MRNSIGTVYTFYSYKGGVGRSMALANVAAMLGKWGKKVLIIDWDLEAPGIERYFSGPSLQLSASPASKNGVVDIVSSFITSSPIDWRDCVIRVKSSEFKCDLSIITAGKRTPDYVDKLQNIVWSDMFSESDFGVYLESLRNEWIEEYDFVLIDSRTGITDIGGVCTIHLPDVLVLMFTTNEQSLDGVTEVMRLARAKHKDLPFDRNYLVALPVPSRDESRTEYETAQQWKEKFSSSLNDLYKDWIPKNIKTSNILDLLRIPYIPYWSFGERLPVIEEGTKDPTSIGFSLEILAKTISSNLDWNSVLDGSAILRSNEYADENNIEGEEMEREQHRMKAQEYIDSRLEDQIKWYSNKSHSNQSLYKLIVITQLLCAASIPLIASGVFLPVKDEIESMVVSALGVIVVICTGLLTLNKYQENWVSYRTTAEELKKEKYRFITETTPYDFPEESFGLFVERVESIISKENTSWNSRYQEKVNVKKRMK